MQLRRDLVRAQEMPAVGLAPADPSEGIYRCESIRECQTSLSPGKTHLSLARTAVYPTDPGGKMSLICLEVGGGGERHSVGGEGTCVRAQKGLWEVSTRNTRVFPFTPRTGLLGGFILSGPLPRKSEI